MLNKRCLIEPTVEDCNTILLSWSYSNESGTCDKGYVCANCVNRFETHQQCKKTCPAKPAQKQRWKLRQLWDCRKWLMRGNGCQAVWFEAGKNRLDLISQLLYYTGCGPDKRKIFQYDFSSKKCHAVNKPPAKSVHQKIHEKKNSKGGAHKARQRIQQIMEEGTLPPSYSLQQPKHHGHRDKGEFAK
uniref:Pancreatic trypsin inhibitor n=1 Tax=Rhipicephalus appendiculatus TaxID=34631 RepID=A0A131Z4U7_RHIAP